MKVFLASVFTSTLTACSAETKPRNVYISDQNFILTATNEPIVLGGPNVVVKGPPYMPFVEGTSFCDDIVDDVCSAAGNCTSCSTFNQADIDHIKSLGWNFIRLGVVWAGAQPTNEDALSADFLTLLHDVLDLTDANDIHVMLDNHGDMVGSAGCGNGVPMWFHTEALAWKNESEALGKPLVTKPPYSLVGLDVKDVDGYDYCGDDEAKWAQYAGDPNYNILNECCLAMNSGNPGGLGYTTVSQAAMDYLVFEGPGRDAFVRYWRLVAEAVIEHPSAFGFELMNEPMTIRRTNMFDTWVACEKAITSVIPDASVSVADIGEGSVFPARLTDLTGGEGFISSDAKDYIASSNNIFYAWHYGNVPQDITNMQAISAAWNIPTFGTELGCEHWDAAAAAGIGHSYWHYSSYCNTGPSFGNLVAPDDTFGACILGWGSGNSSKCT